MEEPFHSVAAILAVAAAVGYLATRMRQPLIVAFIVVGILVGPVGFDWVGVGEPIELFAEIGVAVLLFLVGLKLDVNLVRTTGSVALLTGLGQVAFTSGVGFLLALVLGMDATSALYVAVALTFSSTIIVVKLLSDKRELDELHGRIALGFLIVQDIVVVLVMIVLAAVAGGGDGDLTFELALLIGRGGLFLAGLYAVSRWVLPRLLHQVARSGELLMVGAVAWAVALAALGESLGFSTEVGAFLAGFALGSTPFREAIGATLTPLRDFLLLFFFIELGAKLDLTQIGAEVPSAIVLSLFVLIGNPIIVLVIMGVLGYRKRVGFLAGLTVAQISEFSLIFVALGLEVGHIDESTVGLVTLVGLITIGLSTYLILYSHPLYERLERFLTIFERAQPTKDDTGEGERPADVIVYGYGRYGSDLAHLLADAGLAVLVVDWDPHADAADAQLAPIEMVYGDAEDLEFPGTLPLRTARAVVSTISRADSTRTLVTALHHWDFDGMIAVTAHTKAEAAALEGCGADLVLTPFTDASAMAADRLVAELRERSLSEA